LKLELTLSEDEAVLSESVVLTGNTNLAMAEKA